MSDKTCKLVAAHLEDGDKHVVYISALRVLLEHDGSGWFAQGLDIDYACGGDSFTDVKTRFEKGLAATIARHLQVFGKLDNLMKPAPPEEWRKLLYVAKSQELTMVSCFSEQESVPESFPFRSIAYLEAAHA